jgi:hypothetical protein
VERNREKLGVRARVVRGVLDAHLAWCEEELGPATSARLLEVVPSECRAYLGARGTSFVPFWALVETDRAIATLAGRSRRRVYHALGRHSAVANWSEPYRGFVGDEPHHFFARTTLWHDAFQDFGLASYEKVGLHAGHFTIENCEEFSPVFCASALGYFEGALEMMGAPGPFHGEETMCHCAGDPACVFALHW